MFMTKVFLLLGIGLARANEPEVRDSLVTFSDLDATYQPLVDWWCVDVGGLLMPVGERTHILPSVEVIAAVQGANPNRSSPPLAKGPSSC